MICLTGDVHNISLRNDDQSYLEGTEVDSALHYVKIAKRYCVKNTLFFTGKCVVEEADKINKIKNNLGTELGGHTYSAFSPLILYKLSSRILKLKNGPAFIQRKDINKTNRVFQEYLGIKLNSWRDHAYRHDRNTIPLLKLAGIKYFSDKVGPNYKGPFYEDGICHVPINVLPDHDYIFHASRMPGTFNENSLALKPFQSKAMSISDWLSVVKKQVNKIISFKGIATLLVHPACMEISDNFLTFEKLCEFLSQYKTVRMKDIRI